MSATNKDDKSETLSLFSENRSAARSSGKYSTESSNLSEINRFFNNLGCPLTDDQRQKLSRYRKERKGFLAIENIQSVLNLREPQKGPFNK